MDLSESYCGFCSAGAGSTEISGRQQAKRVSVFYSVTQNSEHPRESSLQATYSLSLIDNVIHLQLTHFNSYGPDDQTVFSVRIHDTPENIWISLQKHQELIYPANQLDAKPRTKKHIKGETPWKGIFIGTLDLPKNAGKKIVIEIKTESTLPEMNGVMTDWEIDLLDN